MMSSPTGSSSPSGSGSPVGAPPGPAGSPPGSPGPSGPTPPPSGPTPQPRRRVDRAAIAISVFAALVSLVALVMAGVAIYQTRPVNEAAPTPTSDPGRTPAGAATETPDATIDASEPTATDPDATEGPVNTALPNGNAQYTLSYEDIKLTLRGDSRYIDLDEPVVNATTERMDVTYSNRSIPGPELAFDSVNVAIAKSPDATPNECAQNIQLSPAETEVKLSQDLVLCAVTNGIGAVNEPQRAKMVRMVVNSISKDDSVLMTVTSWEIPR